jgi:phosphohistidine phosphatase
VVGRDRRVRQIGTDGNIDMKLYFLRHGEADWPEWKKSDDERPLTKSGKKEMHTVSAFLARLKVRPDLILTSPLPRAAQTAEIAAENLEVKCREDQRLAPGFGPAEMEQILSKHSVESLMLVGHEPDFTKTISALTGASLKLSKAGVALVDIDLSSQKGRLLWLFPPKIARK